MQKNSWRVYIADAFAKEVFAGNQAGVVLLEETEDFPDEMIMRKIAAELKHSETAFVKRADRDVFRIRYFTPVEEVELCGHATIGAFGVLYEEGLIKDGSFRLIAGFQKPAGGSKDAGAETLSVEVKGGAVWMDMAPPREIYTLTPREAAELCRAYGLTEEAKRYEAYEADVTQKAGGRPDSHEIHGMLPKIVNTGLSDIILPVGSREALQQAVQDDARVTELSRRYQVVGVHMFCLSEQAELLAECRNFAPLYGISEESATGTANGALTYYLYRQGFTTPGRENVFLQGEAMGKGSYVKSRLEDTLTVKIGGTAVISLKGQLVNMR